MASIKKYALDLSKNKRFCVGIALLFVSASPFTAMAARHEVRPPALNAAGKKLAAKYSAILKHLRDEITHALPHVDPGMVKPFMDAYRAEGSHKPFMMNNHAFTKAIAQCQIIGAPVLSVVDPFLSSSRWDNQLAEASIIADATPRGLAAFAQKSSANEDLIRSLLSNPSLMKQIQSAGGARDGNIGLTMQIYATIEQASPYSHSGILQRLALATALMQKPTLYWKTSFDPVKRYLNFQTAYLKKLLDPAFPTLTTWQCRFVVDDSFSDKQINWFRQMYMNYEPYNIFTKHYLNIVHTDVGYNDMDMTCVPGSRAAVLIAGGGECGARAWIARLGERAFGIPTWGVKQVGHAALSHWTPQGWYTRFAAGWEWVWWHHRSGLHFYLEAQARRFPKQFKKVLRAQWVAATLGEAKPDLMSYGTGGFWYAIADSEQRAIVGPMRYDENHFITTRKPTVTTPSDAALAQKYGPTLAQKVESAPVPYSATHIAVSSAGVITLPAAYGLKTGRTNGIVVSKSYLGGLQITYHVPQPAGRKHIPFHYVINVSHPGTYALTAQIVSVKPTEYLNVAVNSDRHPVVITIPWTNGMWQVTAPVKIRLHRGKNVLTFDRGKDVGLPAKQIFALTIKKFVFTPMN